jgi:UDP-N-acetylglucosamine diphosphorylase / glucose-1-phosphate thymidylyltransferase / UDP-N-acetylgalactosamine diphosphorylase / glucosamine-1-phosphate N-acetyltransferase / galactosamine-1-phosphate N-acetyltransferase
MKKIVFTEEFCQPENLYPFTLTRQVQDIRVGILTIREKWELALGMPSFDKYEDDYKDQDRAITIDESIGDDIIYLIHGNVLPTEKLAKQIKKLKPGEFISAGKNDNIAYCISKEEILNEQQIKVRKAIKLEPELKEVHFPWDIFALNAWAIEEDFKWLTESRKGQRISSTNKTINPRNIFIEKGAEVEFSILNASAGPIYIGKGAVVMEGCLLRGPLAIGAGATVKMGTKIYGATTIGPKCVVGGEIKNTVFFGRSNKAHDGYVGDAVIGEWCNLGAGTSCSNVKNTASDVMVWTPKGQMNAGKKCGVMMGDYSRTAINTSINTGTIIGVSSNVFGNSLTPKYIPNFSWGSDGVERYEFERAIEGIKNWKGMKKETLTESEEFILKHIFDHY